MVLALQRATHHTLRALSAALADLNLSAAEINALANLGDGGSQRPPAERADRHPGQHPDRPARPAGEPRLPRQGAADPADRRSFRLPLTETGQEVAARVRAAIADLERDALSRLDATQHFAGYHAVVTALQEAC